MKKRCDSCNKKIAAQESFCPYCGAYMPEMRDGGARTSGSEGWRAPERAASRRKNRLTIASISALLSLASILVGLLTWMSQRGERVIYVGDEPTASAAAGATRTVSELYTHLDEYPRDFDAVSELVAALCAKGQTGEADNALLLLYQGGCAEPGPFRRAGEALLQAEDQAWAVRAFLTAHTLSGLQSDLDLAASCGAPADIIADGPTSQALEFFFEKPFSRVTWEEVGRIRYMALKSSGAVDFSLSDPYETDELEFEATVQSFYVDSGTASASFLYGLRALRFEQSIDLRDLQLCALTELCGLYVSRAYYISDLQIFSVLPSLQELHVGGSDIVSLEGLESLPSLRALGLEETGIDNLSLLATYQNIDSLILIRNKELQGLGSLSQMAGLRRLSVERQEVTDFQFLGSLKGLEGLTLIDTGIKDFYFISELTELRQLKLHRNSDLKSIAGIGALERIEDLYIPAITGVDEIAGLTGMRSLHLQSPKSLHMIAGLRNLEQLSIGGGGLLDSIEPVRGLQSLRSFTIVPFFPGTGAGQHFYFSLDPLASLPNLTHVTLNDARFYGSSSALFRIASLEHLDLTRSEADVGPGLSGLTSLRTLRMSNFKPLGNVQVYSDGFFTNIDYDRPEIDAVAATLAGLEHLEHLELAECGLTDIGFLHELPALQTAYLADNYITDISALAQSESLRYISLSGNPVRDWAPAEDATGVIVRRS